MLLRMVHFWVSPKCGGASGWSVVQLDYDEELGPVHGVFGVARRKEMHRSTSGEAGLVDQNSGRVAVLSLKRNVGGRGAFQGAVHKEGQQDMSQFDKFV